MKIFGNFVLFLVLVLCFSVPAIASDVAEYAGDSIPAMWWIAPIGSLLALFFAVYFYKKVMSAPAGNEKMVEIAHYVREGAYAYLFRQYRVVAMVFLVLSIIFAVLAYFKVQNPFVPIAFLTGGFFSGLCGFLGMKTSRFTGCVSFRSSNGAGGSWFRFAGYFALVSDFG